MFNLLWVNFLAFSRGYIMKIRLYILMQPSYHSEVLQSPLSTKNLYIVWRGVELPLLCVYPIPDKLIELGALGVLQPFERLTGRLAEEFVEGHRVVLLAGLAAESARTSMDRVRAGRLRRGQSCVESFS